MHFPPHRSHRTAKLSACSALLTRLPSAICALVITLVCALSLSTASGQAVVAATGSKTATSGSSSSNNPSVNKPDNLAVGDLMIMSVCIEGGSDNNVTTASGSGWTKIIQQNNSSNVGVAVFWKIANSTDVAAPTFSASLSQSKINSIGILRITGHNASAPIAAFGGANSSTASAITTTAANQRVLTFHGVKKSSTFTASGRTEIYDVAANTASHAVYHYNQVAQGSTGTKATTLSQSAETVSIQVAIATAPAATPAISSTGTLAAVNTTFPNASPSPTSFNVSGANMTAGILVTAPANFQVSNAVGGTYSSTVTIGAAGPIASTPVFVRLAANTPAGTYSGNLVLSSTGATSVNVATVSSVVSKATPTITTAPTASAITFGQTLASSTLSGGVGSVGGGFAFTPSSTAPNAGTAAQSFTFTPTDSANYNTVTGTVSVTVNKATPTITTAPSASGITFGQTLANSTLSGGSASTPGTFAFTTSATAPNAGTASQSVTFTPTDSVNYNTATGTVNVTVAQRPLTITAAAASKALGEPDPTLTYSSSGLLAGGSITGSLARSSGETTGSYPITQGTLSAGSNYTISFTGANFVITGLKAMADSIQKPGDGSALKIPVASLLANDGTLNADGEIVAAPNLTITGAQTSLGAALAIRGQFILFLPTTNGQETLTYTVSNGTATSTATVTLTGEASAPPFSLEVIKRGTAAVSGDSTSVTHDFLGVPNQTYRIQYSTNLSTWTTAPDQSSGATGSFSVTFTQSGNFAAAWNSQMFFRATKP